MNSVYFIRVQFLLRFNQIAGLCTKMAELLLRLEKQLLPDEWRMLSDRWWIQEGDSITAQRLRYEALCVFVVACLVYCDVIRISFCIDFKNI